jgi:cytochrome c oxidase subunit II
VGGEESAGASAPPPDTRGELQDGKEMVRFGRLTTRKTAFQLLTALTAGVVATTAFVATAAAEQPHDWQIGMQPAATLVKERLSAFHDELQVIIFLIAGFVMCLLLYCILRFNARRNPAPSRTTHNPLLEIMWTVVPVLILITIAVPSFKLMYYMADIPNQALVIKVTGHQWYWTYSYPTEGGLTFDSNVLLGANRKPEEPRLLAVDNPLVVPVGENVEVDVTSTDVIHSWFISSFGVQEYAIIGRDNKSWFNVLHPGTYYGQCNQLCGINHSRMPIEVVALSKADFQQWLGEAKKKFAANGAAAAVRVAAADRAAGN